MAPLPQHMKLISSPILAQHDSTADQKKLRDDELLAGRWTWTDCNQEGKNLPPFSQRRNSSVSHELNWAWKGEVRTLNDENRTRKDFQSSETKAEIVWSNFEKGVFEENRLLKSPKSSWPRRGFPWRCLLNSEGATKEVIASPAENIHKYWGLCPSWRKYIVEWVEKRTRVHVRPRARRNGCNCSLNRCCKAFQMWRFTKNKQKPTSRKPE